MSYESGSLGRLLHSELSQPASYAFASIGKEAHQLFGLHPGGRGFRGHVVVCQFIREVLVLVVGILRLRGEIGRGRPRVTIVLVCSLVLVILVVPSVVRLVVLLLILVVVVIFPVAVVGFLTSVCSLVVGACSALVISAVVAVRFRRIVNRRWGYLIRIRDAVAVLDRTILVVVVDAVLVVARLVTFVVFLVAVIFVIVFVIVLVVVGVVGFVVVVVRILPAILVFVVVLSLVLVVVGFVSFTIRVWIFIVVERVRVSSFVGLYFALNSRGRLLLRRVIIRRYGRIVVIRQLVGEIDVLVVRLRGTHPPLVDYLLRHFFLGIERDGHFFFLRAVNRLVVDRVAPRGIETPRGRPLSDAVGIAASCRGEGVREPRIVIHEGNDSATVVAKAGNLATDRAGCQQSPTQESHQRKERKSRTVHRFQSS